MDSQPKIPRKRVANFTGDEKAILAQLIKNRPIIESKLTDGQSVAKKQAAWDSITQEFNCNANVHKRETITLKRAWDNMKAFTRKARATERGNLIRTGGGPQLPPPPPQLGAIISMVEDAAPVMICEIKNAFDSDGTVLNAIDDDVSINASETKNDENKVDTEEYGALINQEKLATNSLQIEDAQNSPGEMELFKSTDSVRRPTDYVRREAIMRVKHLEYKKKIEIQILKAQLEAEQIKIEVGHINKKAALLEEAKNQILLEKAKIELEALKKTIS